MTNPLFDALFAPHLGKDTPFLHLEDGTTLTHDAFLRKAAQIGGALVELDLSAGDRVALQVHKSPEALAVYAACVQKGIIFLPLNTGYTASELDYFIENSGAKLVICDPSKENDIAPIAERTRAQILTLDGSGDGSLIESAKSQPEMTSTTARNGDDLAAFLYTSGTTGRSKGAMLTQDNLLSNAEVLKDYWAFTRADVLLHALPIFHTHGLFVASNVMLLCGGAMVFMPSFNPDTILKHMPRATSMMGVPTFYTRLLDHDGFTREAAAHMRLFISGSAPMLSETHEQFESLTGQRILERYGMTETNMNTSNPYEGARKAGTVGFALPGVDVKICDPESGATLPQGEIGVIEVRGPNVFKGYWKMPEKTREELREDGFFITGDLGQIDADGYVQIVGRGKDLIISGGYNIYPKEIEMVVDDQPGVKESAVVGVPHPDFGESPVAVVVPDGAGPDIDQITSACATELARFKHPRKIIILDALPRNTMGKVQKNALREDYKTLFTNTES
ncbi:MAG: malonyl-CoA synthase [Planktotalea sp.]|jgi:malonyl-CoA/methylmalonyl-CoA synthetase|uniref:malonate--CoA ligase n=1 Tax=Planktotalea sp. TaxID=2029877 RepID=UPI0001838E1B|nr:malonyl-CoA synthase [Planktotalea sp.]EDZ43982.1 long-chain-fatty-acid--CoA ligase, putative [Rhodobacteraceae bacterium HTCC2083]MBT5821839.1 malonyl-CoA synthase [Paracoccaceae bacterium]MDG1078373.1 malonyl-CoA synthase [Planktotalea sp.]MDG1082920.1 malonyl-CoA synthase [Planktotalea sp.]HCW85356.1 malonyl-CoA synthase [Paracoccaceae bacterium]